MTDLTLSTLAARANAEHANAEAKAHEAIIHARNAGLALLEAKAGCRHGEWLPWVAANFHGSARTAQAYMRVADNWPALESNTQSAAHLSLAGALELLERESPIEKFRRLRDAILASEDLDEIHPLMKRCHAAGKEILSVKQDLGQLAELARDDLLEHLSRLNLDNSRALGEALAALPGGRPDAGALTTTAEGTQ